MFHLKADRHGAQGRSKPRLGGVRSKAIEWPFSFDAEFQHGLEVILGALEPAP